MIIVINFIVFRYKFEGFIIEIFVYLSIYNRREMEYVKMFVNKLIDNKNMVYINCGNFFSYYKNFIGKLVGFGIYMILSEYLGLGN